MTERPNDLSPAPPVLDYAVAPDAPPAPVPLEKPWVGLSAAQVFVRVLGVLVLIGLAAWLATYLASPAGHHWRERKFVQDWVRAHRVVAPLGFVAAYVALACLLLPVWWLQILAGYCFGLFMGVVWVQLGAAVASVLSLLLSRWLIGEWFVRRVGGRMAKLRALEEKMGHNGLLVVMAVRLTHVVPFGISNYLFGLTRITAIDVGLGTLWGGTSTAMFYVAIGAGRYLLRSWRFWTIFAVVNVLLLVPLILRYLKPNWFKKIGVE